MSKQELGRIMTELAGTRKEKFAFQTKNGQLKAALKATVQQNQGLTYSFVELIRSLNEFVVNCTLPYVDVDRLT